jgi:hypothetical protein
MIVYLYFKDKKNIENCEKMYCSKRPHFLPKRPTFFPKINHYKKNILIM